MAQTWKIKGQVYTHGQLMELRRQGLDPRKDEIVMSAVTPRPEKAEDKKCKVVITEEMAAEYPELEEQGVKVGDEMEVGDEKDAAPESLRDKPLSELKNMAKALGFKTSNKTKKQELLDFLEKKPELESNEAAQ